MAPSYPFKELFLSEVSKIGGGMVNCHAHLDRAGTLTKDIWQQASALMEKKWFLMRDIKTAYSNDPETFKNRIREYIEYFKEQGITACRTHVDADSIVEMKVVNMMAEIREEYKDNFILQLVAHPLEGFLNEDATDFDKHKTDLFEQACDICDVVGGLPSRDRKMTNGDKKHADFLFNVAKNLGKDIDAHIDQENNPDEKDSEWFLDKIEEHGMQGRVTIVHAISVACQPTDYRNMIYKKFADTDTNCSVCPKAAISMKQLKDKVAPLHNCLAQVDEMLDAGINVSIGTDNISDIFVPEDNGDLYEEISFLASACRLYDIEKLAKIAGINGKKTLKI